MCPFPTCPCVSAQASMTSFTRMDSAMEVVGAPAHPAHRHRPPHRPLRRHRHRLLHHHPPPPWLHPRCLLQHVPPSLRQLSEYVRSPRSGNCWCGNSYLDGDAFCTLRVMLRFYFDKSICDFFGDTFFPPLPTQHGEKMKGIDDTIGILYTGLVVSRHPAVAAMPRPCTRAFC